MVENGARRQGDAPPGRPQRHTPFFTGSGAEYFRIWVVNVFLTVATLGLYTAWAKVRTRRYFYANTLLAGHPFDYLADPWAIFKGYVIIFVAFAIYQASQGVVPPLAAAAAILFYLIFPFLMYKSLRFFAHNSSHRNIRMVFSGTLGESYLVYLLFPLLLPVTLGLLYPYWAYRRKRYLLDNLAYGSSGFRFEGRAGAFYGIYSLAAFFYVALAGLAIAAIFSMVTRVRGLDLSSPEMQVITGVVPVVLTLAFVGVSAVAQQWIYARVTNYAWSQTRIGDLRFDSRINPWKLAWIRLSNLALMGLTLGVFIPWARVRRTRYLLDSLTVAAPAGLDAFHGGISPDVSAFGEAAMDFFDFEIGL